MKRDSNKDTLRRTEAPRNDATGRAEMTNKQARAIKKIKSCPCGAGFLTMRGPFEHSVNGVGGLFFSLECPQCGRSSESAWTEKGAVRSWNRAVRKAERQSNEKSSNASKS